METEQNQTPTTEQPPAPPAKPDRAQDIESLRLENQRLRDDIRKAAEVRDKAKEIARNEVKEQLDTMGEIVSQLQQQVLSSASRAVDAVALSQVPEPLRPIAQTLLAGLRAEDPTLAIKPDADVDALAANTAARLRALLEKAGPLNTAPTVPKPTVPQSSEVSIANMTADELRAFYGHKRR